MANVGTSTVAYATQQPTGSLVFIASDGTACVLWNDGTNQKFSYASSPYSSWTTTTLITGLNMALAGRFRAGSDNIDVVTGAATTVRPNYYPLTKIGATYSLGAANQISATAAGTSAVGNVMAYCGQDPQGRHWIVCGGASTYTTETGYFSPANAPTTAGWTASPTSAVVQTGDVNLPAGDQIGNFILRIWWNGTALQYSRADNSAASVGAWSTAATIPNLTGSPNASSRVVFRALSATQALLVYSTASGIYAQTYTPSTNTFSAATQLSTNASDRHPTVATDGTGNAWVVWCSFAAANSYALVYKRWNGSVWDTSATTLVASGTNIANPSAGFGNFSELGVAYTVGTANPFTVGWITASFPTTSTRTIPASAALSAQRTIPTSAAFSSPQWYASGWRYKKQLTIDHTKVSGGVDLTSFPVLVTLTDVDFKTVGNGGKVQNASGFDLVFLDSTQTTQLDHEIEKYDGVAGTITMWVRVPTLSASADTIIYCYFGNTTVAATRENKTGVWDSAFRGVYHLGNGTTLSLSDSSANAYNGANNGATATASGQIDGAASFNGTSNYITSGLPLGGLSAFTVEFWGYLSSYSGLFDRALANDDPPTSHNGFEIYIDATAHSLALVLGNGTTAVYSYGTPAPGTAVWFHVAFTYNGTTITTYFNGALQGTAAQSGSMGAPAQSLNIGAMGWAVTGYWTGRLDEVRLSTSARAIGWIATGYNNQSAPGTFITAGATSALITTGARTVGASAALLATKTRVVGASAVLWTTPLPIYWGLYQTPYYPATSGISAAETTIGKQLAIFQGYSQWSGGDPANNVFSATWASAVRAHGSLPLLTWVPFDGSAGVTNPSYTLASIYNGSHDTYITQFAQDAAAWGYPLFLRFAQEMNGNWYPWCEGVNGNVAGDFVLAWKHIHDIFVAQGATNVTWVWCPAQVESGAFSGMYPGDAYVDWVAVDSYNTSTLTFSQVFAASYAALVALAPSKPIMIAETNSIEGAAGVKDAWYTDMLTVQLPGSSFNKIRALVIFNEAFDTYTTMPINSTPGALAAFSAGINTGYYVGPVFSGITVSPIPPYGITVSTRTIPASVALSKTSSRSIGITAALLASRTRTVTASTALSASRTRTINASAALLGTASRSVTASSALLQTAVRQAPASAALTFTFSRTTPASAALLATVTRQVLASSALQSQASRSIPVSAALSITRIVPTSGALSLTQARTIAASSALFLTQTRQVGASVALLATITRLVPATSALQKQASRTIPATGALSISRVVPGSVALLLASSRVVPASVALQATSTRTIGSSVALLGTRSRQLTASATLLASISRSIGASSALLGTRTRTIPTDAALSLTGTVTRTIPATAALLASISRNVAASAALGLSNVSRTVPVTVALLRQASRSIPTSTPLQAVGSRQVVASAALVSQASRSIPGSVALIATLTRSSGATAALIATSSRTLGTSVALTLPGVKFRDIPCSATLSGGSRVIPAMVALRGTRTRSIPCTASISLPVQGLQIGIPASAALSATSARFVVCTVALLASNASLRFRSGVADVRVRSGTASIIVS